MLSYMLPTGDKPPPGETHNQAYNRLSRLQNRNNNNNSQIIRNGIINTTTIMQPRRTIEVNKNSGTSSMMITTTLPLKNIDNINDNNCKKNDINNHSPKHNGTTIITTATPRKSTLHTSRVTKDDSLHSINSEASTGGGSDRKSKIANGAKHANLKRVSFGSSKGSMVETLVYETPVQEEPEINHFLDHNGRLPMIPVPDTDEGREKVRVAFLGPQPHPVTPGVLLLDPILPPGVHLLDNMSTGPAELLTTHTEHTSPAYHTQISTDSGWDNPFRPDGDLSREADEIVELIKGGKPITPTPGQNTPPLPGCDDKNNVDDIDTSKNTIINTSGRITNGNGTQNINVNKQPINEKVGPATNAATVEVGRVMSQGPGDASLVEHVTLKKKPKCKCCVLQ